MIIERDGPAILPGHPFVRFSPEDISDYSSCYGKAGQGDRWACKNKLFRLKGMKKAAGRILLPYTHEKSYRLSYS